MTSVVVDDLDGSQPMCPLWAAMNQVWRDLWQDKMIKKVNLITHKACQHSNYYLGLQCVAVITWSLFSQIFTKDTPLLVR